MFPKELNNVILETISLTPGEWKNIKSVANIYPPTGLISYIFYYQDDNDIWHVSHTSNTQTLPIRDKYVERLIDIQKNIYVYEKTTKKWADQIEFSITNINDKVNATIEFKFDIWNKLYNGNEKITCEQLLWENINFNYVPESKHDLAFIEEAKKAHNIE